MESTKTIVIFASGGGSNAQAIIDYLKGKPVKIASFFVNNPTAFAIERAKNLNVPCVVFGKEKFRNGEILQQLKIIDPDLIVLAGFLWLIPSDIIKAFPDKIINIHPALLPKYGGKGMHGMNVHRAVKEAKEKNSGITIHYVNENYDEGNIIHQSECEISPSDSAEIIAKKVLDLEHKFYPKVVEELLFL